jgi:recombining binding protein (suppressor of hairless)
MAQTTLASVMTATAIPDNRSQLAALSDETVVSRPASDHHYFLKPTPSPAFDTTIPPHRSAVGVMDFATASHQTMYNQADLDQAFNSLQTVDNTSPSHHLSQAIPQHNFDHPESNREVSDHPSYDLFSNNNNSFASQRYRANSSSSSSLGPAYAMSPDGVYSHASFGDSVPSFGSASNSYDIMSNVSYSSGKVSPLTPNDTMTGIQQSPVFPHSMSINGHQKDFSNGHTYPELLTDRRVSGVGGGVYHSEFSDDYGMNGAGYPPSALQPFQDRMRFQAESRFSHSGLPPSVPSHMGHSPDMFRGVAPQATHSFRPDSGLPGYDDMYLGNPHADMSLRMPGIDGFSSMRNGHPGMGSSNDLQAFIR